MDASSYQTVWIGIPASPAATGSEIEKRGAAESRIGTLFQARVNYQPVPDLERFS
jgi:hypothetical protein